MLLLGAAALPASRMPGPEPPHREKTKTRSDHDSTRPLRLGFAVILLLIVFAAGWLAGRLGIGSVVQPASLTEVERQFTERMRDVTMVGTFTVAGRERRDRAPDRYDIAERREGGRQPVALQRQDRRALRSSAPIVVPMQFNGDTPVIMMTDTSLPGVGAFTVRVLFYGDRYAGTWQHGAVGGHMSGIIEKSSTPVQ